MDMVKVALIVTTYNRPEDLDRTLESLRETTKDEPHEVKIIVYDDTIENKGLRHGLNWLINETKKEQFDYISYCQDDVVFKKGWLPRCIEVWDMYKPGFVSCHDAPEHPIIGITTEGYLVKDTIRATHMFASAKRWYEFGEIPDLTPGVVTPRAGRGSLVDWWLVRDGPNSTLRRGEKCIIIPGYCVHFGYNKSNWGQWNQEKWFVK
jgi:glycosyltransferase involved in cell wall biosynthesis